jgi:quercetin dioxygenase-like cupin family protein
MPSAKIYRWDEAEEKDFGTVRSRSIMDTPEVPGLSLSWVFKQKAPTDRMSKSNEIDIAYYVIEGEGHVLIDGVEHPIAKGDVLYVPRGAEYRMSDGLETVAACTPRFGR